MPSVSVDREEVIFEEGVPRDPHHIYDLLTGILAEQGRVVVAFTVDGVDCLRSEELPQAFQDIQIESQTHHELTLRLVEETGKHLEGIEKDLLAYASNILNPLVAGCSADG